VPPAILIAAFAVGYLLGSIPFGVVLTRAAGAADVRSIGSGNIGATNVLRTGRKDLAAATFLCDALKGCVAVVVALGWGRDAALAAAAGAFFGHLFPVWLAFVGGKGVSTFVGCLLGVYWPAAAVFAVVWLSVAYATKYSSAAGLSAAASAPAVLLFSGRAMEAGVFLLLAAALFWRHRENISRLLAGTESKIGRSA
jgi:acyl phosphate:glycerol-3-phosphate acyltransferase